MQSILADGLAEYIHDHTTPPAPLFEELREVTFAELEDPQMQVGRVEGAFLRQMVQISGARSILEIGTYSGYSSLAMASGLPDGGRLITCDIDPVATAVAQRFFDRAPYGDKIELRLGPASDTIGMRIIEKTHTGEDIGNDHHAVADRLIRLAEGGDCPIIDADARAIQSFDRATGAQRLLFEAERRLTDP